jgi:hypothetical protein
MKYRKFESEKIFAFFLLGVPLTLVFVQREHYFRYSRYVPEIFIAIAFKFFFFIARNSFSRNFFWDLSYGAFLSVF